MKKNGENAEEVHNTNLYHSSFVTIIRAIKIPCFWRQFGIFPTQIDFTPPIFPYVHEIKIIYNIIYEKNRNHAEEVAKTN